MEETKRSHDNSVAVAAHYDAILEEGNDPVLDPPVLQAYMRQWDGDTFLDLLQLTKEKTVLEIGVGTGRLALQTAPKCKTFYGIDLSSKTIARAKRHLASFPNVHLLHGDFLSYPFSQTFDVIYATLTLLHIQEKEVAFHRVASLLRADGCFVLSIDKQASSVLKYGNRELRIFPDNPKETTALLQAAGLRVTNQTETPLAYLFKAEKLNRI